MKTGLLFGTFNPIHNAHIAIAKFMVDNAGLDEVWLVVSPHNPLKKKEDLLDENVRLDLVKLALRKHPEIKASDIEFNLPRPSYTIDTLSELSKKYPSKNFVLIIGEDNLRNFSQWKDFDKILNAYEVFVFPRKVLNNETVATISEIQHPHIHKFSFPLQDISATAIREGIRTGADVSNMLPEEVYREILLHRYYLS